MDLPYITPPFMPLRTCSLCGVTNDTTYVHHATPEVEEGRAHSSGYIHDEPVCGPCFREMCAQKERWLHDPIEDLDGWVDCQLSQIGMGKVERNALPTKIPTSLVERIPVEIMGALLGGCLLKDQGMGFGGLAGSGKTSAVAALVRACIYRNAHNRTPFYELLSIRHILWMCWPEVAHRWRMDALDRSVGRGIERARSAKLLILDDLGRETHRREASEDVTVGHLNAILTHRDREGLPTLWTTNFNEAELIDRYGMGMVRRLLRLNPLIYIEDADFHPNAL